MTRLIQIFTNFLLPPPNSVQLSEGPEDDLPVALLLFEGSSFTYNRITDAGRYEPARYIIFAGLRKKLP